MYTTIKHDIVEEHFEKQPQQRPTLGLGELPTIVINERTLVFRMDSRTLWTRYSLGMINYSVSSFGNLGSTPSVEKNLAKAASAIGDFFVPYYGMRAGTKIGSLLHDSYLAICKILSHFIPGITNLSHMRKSVLNTLMTNPEP
jgi:hypothetical protein